MGLSGSPNRQRVSASFADENESVHRIITIIDPRECGFGGFHGGELFCEKRGF
jgi:hypothetical protein